MEDLMASQNSLITKLKTECKFLLDQLQTLTFKYQLVKTNLAIIFKSNRLVRLVTVLNCQTENVKNLSVHFYHALLFVKTKGETIKLQIDVETFRQRFAAKFELPIAKGGVFK